MVGGRLADVLREDHVRDDLDLSRLLLRLIVGMVRLSHPGLELVLHLLLIPGSQLSYQSQLLLIHHRRQLVLILG